MKIDLHIHTKTCSDGALSVEAVFGEAAKSNIELMSITACAVIVMQAK